MAQTSRSTALEQALWVREGPFDRLVRHLDRGVQDLSIRYSERLTGGWPRHLGGQPRRLLRQRHGRDRERALRDGAGLPALTWRGREDLELATLEWVDWFNNRRLYSGLGYVTPAE